MINRIRQKRRGGQTAIEYLLLLGVVVAIVMVGFRTFLPRTYDTSEKYFNKVLCGMMDEPPSSNFFDFALK